MQVILQSPIYSSFLGVKIDTINYDLWDTSIANMYVNQGTVLEACPFIWGFYTNFVMTVLCKKEMFSF